ncbi:conserved hypothetical protein, partial [Ricinus communis]
MEARAGRNGPCTSVAPLGVGRQLFDAAAGVEQVLVPVGAAFDDGRLDQHHQLALLVDPVLRFEQVADDRDRAGARHLRLVVRGRLAHQAADGDHLAVLAAHHAVDFGGGRRRQRQRQAARGAEVDRLAHGGHLAHRRMHVQQDVPAGVDLRRHVQHHTGEEGLQLHAGAGGVAAVGQVGGGAHAGHVELVGADLQDRLLVVHRRHARAGQHVHAALRLEEGNQCGEITGLEGETEQRARALGGVRQREAGTGRDAVGADRRRLAAVERQGLQARARADEAGRHAVGVLAAEGRERGPVHAALELVVQLHFEDLRFQDHLP